MPRHKEPGSRSDRKEKRERQARTREGLIALHEQLVKKIESGGFPRDEEVRFIKNFGELLAVAEAREESKSKKEVQLPEGKLKEFVERFWKVKEECGVSTREDYEKVMEKAGYVLCVYCGYMHPKEAYCPFKAIRDKRKSTVTETD